MSGDLNCPMAAKVASIFTPKPQVWRHRRRRSAAEEPRPPAQDTRKLRLCGLVAAVPGGACAGGARRALSVGYLLGRLGATWRMPDEERRRSWTASAPGLQSPPGGDRDFPR